jgi:hypothetical protein
MEEAAQTPGRWSPFTWADTPWTVAALLGVWGVMIGIEEFFWADLFMVLAGVWCSVRLFRDCSTPGRRRISAFILGLLIFWSIVGVDLTLTARKKASSEAKADQIPKLNEKISELQETVRSQNQQIIQQQSQSNQKLSDISAENIALRKSVEVKDAALVSIAKQQYALNFFPQVVVTTNESADTMYVQNHGKTNIDLYRLIVQGFDETGAVKRTTIAPDAFMSYTMKEQKKTQIINQAPFTNGEAVLSGEVYLVTLDNKKYEMPFSWYFDVKDGKISKSYIVDGSIANEK